MVNLLITHKIGFRSSNTNPRVKPSSWAHNLWPFFYEQENSHVPDVCKSIWGRRKQLSWRHQQGHQLVQLSPERNHNSTFIVMDRSLVVLAVLTHSPLLLSPACLWTHEISWRHGNLLRDWTMATNLVKEPLLKGGFNRPAAIADTLLLFCFLRWAGGKKNRSFSTFLCSREFREHFFALLYWITLKF